MRRSAPIFLSDATGTVTHMNTPRPGQAGASPVPRAVPADIAAANAAYIATLALPPLNAGQARLVRTLAEAAHERRTGAKASTTTAA